MPKEAPVERFRIACEVTAAQLGPTVAQLTKLGLINVHFELIEDVRGFAKKVVHEISAEDFLKAWIADHPTFKAIEAVKHFEENGRARGGAYPALGELVEQKILKKLDKGNYARADIKHLAAPKKKAASNARRHMANAQKYEISNGDFILRAGRRSQGRFNTTRIKELFEKDGRNVGSVSPCINELLDKKLVKRVGNGEYVLLQNATKPSSEPPPKANGNDVAPAHTTEIAHG